MAVGGCSTPEFWYVHHTVALCRVLEYGSVSVREGERLSLSQTAGEEALGVKVALVSHKEVAEYDDSGKRHSYSG